MHGPFRLFFVTLAVCASFVAVAAMLVLIVYLSCFFIDYGLGIRVNDQTVIVVGIGVLLFFIAFARLAVRFMGPMQRDATPRAREGSLDADETRMMQEIHRGLSQMEGRIETLETILLDRSQRGAHIPL